MSKSEKPRSYSVLTYLLLIWRPGDGRFGDIRFSGVYATSKSPCDNRATMNEPVLRGDLKITPTRHVHSKPHDTSVTTMN